jgi:ribosome-associated toxin RatA of RatAB toxin-antitoxin module
VADGAIGAAVGVGGAAPRGLFTLPSLGGGVKKQLDMVKMVAHPPWHMYEVVADVAAYSRFLPFCTRSVLCRRYPNGDFDAQLAIGFQLFHETYTSRVTVDPRQRTVSATLVESAIFRKLKSHWRLLPVDGSPNRCRCVAHPSSRLHHTWTAGGLGWRRCDEHRKVSRRGGRGGGGAGRVGAHGRIEFHVEFEVKAENVLQGAAINAIFEDLSRQQMDAFAARASAVPYSLDDAHE